MFKKDGVIPNNMTKKSTKIHVKNVNSRAKTPYEKELEKKNYELEARLAFYQKYQELLEKDNKKKQFIVS